MKKRASAPKLLADMGANVIKIEKPGLVPSRDIGPFLNNSSHPERSLFFYYHNTNKLSMTLNLEHCEGKKIFLRLLENTNIIVETFSPGEEKLRRIENQNLTVFGADAWYIHQTHNPLAQ
ncbi:MAG: CoA transferase [Candidatus Hodarchaeota archaeon]